MRKRATDRYITDMLLRDMKVEFGICEYCKDKKEVSKFKKYKGNFYCKKCFYQLELDKKEEK